MLIVKRNKYLEFKNAVDRDSNIRFNFYLFDNYPILKRKFSFNGLLELVSNKLIFGFDYLNIEAEIVFGEYYMKDPFFQDVISECDTMSKIERDLYINELIQEYKINVLGDKHENLIKLIDNSDISISIFFLKNKLNFFKKNINEVSFYLNEDCIFGVNYKNNQYIDF